MSFDPEGWLELEELIEAASRQGNAIDRELLHRVLTQDGKQRFALSEDGSRIRACQGHSVINVDLGLETVRPPEHLFHGNLPFKFIFHPIAIDPFYDSSIELVRQTVVNT